MNFCLKVRHGRIVVKQDPDYDHLIVVSFQEFIKGHPGKANDIIMMRPLKTWAGCPWWIKKVVQYNERLKKCGGRYKSYVAIQ